MPLKLCENPFFNFFAERVFARIATQSADFGECLVTLEQIEKSKLTNDKNLWFQEWNALADRIFSIGENCEKNGHLQSAKESYFRACTYYQASYLPLFGAPVDPRLKANFEKEVLAFQKACALMPSAIEILEIPFENTTLPAYFVTVDSEKKPRPTIIYTNGYDSNIQEMYFYHAPEAIKRGYNILLFDGPGQGRNLIRDGKSFIPNWEDVVKAVVDYAVTKDTIDKEKLILAGWSFGGFLAPRAAAFEKRLKALIADPGQWDQRDLIAESFGLSKEEKEAFPNISDKKIQELENWMDTKASETLRWRIINRVYWAHGVKSLSEYFHTIDPYEISSVADQIQCPTLITYAEGDSIAKNASKLYEAIKAPKELITFTLAEGSGTHCETLGRMLYHQRVYDWLDTLFKKD